MNISAYLSLQRSLLSLIQEKVVINTVDLANILDVTSHTISRHCTELRRKKILNSWEVDRQTYWSFMTKSQYEAYLKNGKASEIHIEEEGSIVEA